MKISALIVLVGLMGTSCAHIHQRGGCCKKKNYSKHFMKMDKNEDGMLSKKEWDMSSKDMFMMMDADKNSKISMEEWKMGKMKSKKKSCSRK